MSNQTKIGGEQRKYWVKEREDGTHQLMRHEEACNGLIRNSEFQFWMEIESLEDLVKKLRRTLIDMDCRCADFSGQKCNRCSALEEMP